MQFVRMPGVLFIKTVVKVTILLNNVYVNIADKLSTNKGGWQNLVNMYTDLSSSIVQQEWVWAWPSWLLLLPSSHCQWAPPASPGTSGPVAEGGRHQDSSDELDLASASTATEYIKNLISYTAIIIIKRQVLDTQNLSGWWLDSVPCIGLTPHPPLLLGL